MATPSKSTSKSTAKSPSKAKRSPTRSSTSKKAPTQRKPSSKTATPRTQKSTSKSISKSTPKSASKQTSRSTSALKWPAKTELVGLTFELSVSEPATLPLQYAVGLHAWLLDQVRQSDPALSAEMHDGETEKPFNISGLEGAIATQGRQISLHPDQRYRWHVHGLSRPVVKWLGQWLKVPPEVVGLRQAPLTIKDISISQAPTTYKQLQQATYDDSTTVKLNFLTPTSFRRKGHHLPLPWPPNIFHSYLRRWNMFSGEKVNQNLFLEWIDHAVIVRSHRVESMKVAAGKRGSVTGFVGRLELGLDRQARENEEFCQLFYRLAHLAPYCGTGHKTTFGLGQTRLGWRESPQAAETEVASSLLANRIAELTELFLSQRKRQGGDRAQKTAETWATILARREVGESLEAIAKDMEMKYETVKTYAKLARRSLR